MCILVRVTEYGNFSYRWDLTLEIQLFFFFFFFAFETNQNKVLLRIST
jgi:hypothetical protein